jgi:hypothetical protein
MNSTAIGPFPSKTDRLKVLLVTVRIWSLDIFRGVVLGFSDASLLVEVSFRSWVPGSGVRERMFTLHSVLPMGCFAVQYGTPLRNEIVWFRLCVETEGDVGIAVRAINTPSPTQLETAQWTNHIRASSRMKCVPGVIHTLDLRGERANEYFPVEFEGRNVGTISPNHPLKPCYMTSVKARRINHMMFPCLLCKQMEPVDFFAASNLIGHRINSFGAPPESRFPQFGNTWEQ